VIPLKVARIKLSKDLADLDFNVAELLESHDSEEVRIVAENIATEKILEEGWGTERYKIPNVNGLGRPLTRFELEEIMREDMLSGR
jgi:hypothetical protein